MNPYDQNGVDQRFEVALQRCRDHGFHRLAGHYEKAQGMQRAHAVRFLEAIFTVREQNMRKRMRAYVTAIALIVMLYLSLLMWRGIP